MNDTTERTTRELHGHKVNPVNDKLTITVMDMPGSGGANHAYLIDGYTAPNPSDPGKGGDTGTLILFQNGPIAEVGVNGITHEALLAIVIDRLQAFQRGPYSCRENALALTKLEEAQHWLHHRTAARMQRGVEGTHAK